MGSAAAAIPSAVAVQESFAQLERQRELIASCTTLWKELSEHFSALERVLEVRSSSLRSKRASLDDATGRALDSLRRRELSINSSVDRVLAELGDRRAAAMRAFSAASAAAAASPEGNGPDLTGKLRALCATMDADGFLDLVVAKKKEMEVLRAEIPTALAECIDPAKFVMDAISRVFPVDKRAAAVKSPNDLGWACVLILESLVPVLSDPELGSVRLLVTRVARERAKEMAKEWKEALEQRGGMDTVKPPDAHTFLQHVVTFGILAKEDKELYRRLVVSFAWRRQMPKLALSLGLQDEMESIIEELVSNGHQLDAINFAYEAGLQEKFPPVPLLESFLNESKKVSNSVSDDHNSGPTVISTNRKEQSVLRAAMKCIEDHKLQSEFPLENLQKRLEELEKAKAEKKKPSPVVAGPANKRTRASNGGPMPPAKAGRLTNNAYVSSFPAAPAFVRSPSAHTTYPAAAPAYSYDRPGGHGVYGSRSPPAIRDAYGYPAEEVPPALGAPYMSPPINYPAYGGYNTGLGGYNNPLGPGYQQAYYR